MKTVKPIFSEKILRRNGNGKVLTQGLEMVKTFNNFFKSIVQTLCNRAEKPCTESDIVRLLDPVSTAINTYENHAIIFSIK